MNKTFINKRMINKIQNKPKFYNINNSNELIYENGNKVKFIYNKLIILNYLIIILLTLNIFLLFILLYKKMNTLFYINLVLNFTIFILLLFYEYLNFIYYKEKLLVISFKNYLSYYFINNSLNYFNFLVFLVNPLEFFENFTFQIYDFILKIYLIYNINDLIFLINIWKFYLLFIYSIKINIFNNYRSERICRLFSNEFGIIFGLKCLLKEKILSLSIFILFYIIIIFVYLINILEKPYYLINNELFYNSNIFWLGFISISQVGYGDINVKTFLGKIIVLINWFFGFIWISNLIIGIIKVIPLKHNERISHHFLKKIILKDIFIKKYKKKIANFIIKNYLKKNIIMDKDLEKIVNEISNIRLKLKYIFRLLPKLKNNNLEIININWDYSFRVIYFEINNLLNKIIKIQYTKKGKMNTSLLSTHY